MMDVREAGEAGGAGGSSSALPVAFGVNPIMRNLQHLSQSFKKERMTYSQGRLPMR